MEPLNILALIHNTYGLVIALKDNLLVLDIIKHSMREFEVLINMH